MNAQDKLQQKILPVHRIAHAGLTIHSAQDLDTQSPPNAASQPSLGRLFGVLALVVAVVAACYAPGTQTPSTSTTSSAMTAPVTPAPDAGEIGALAEQAYVFAYPMLENYKTMYMNAIDTQSHSYRAPFSHLYHFTELGGPQKTDVVRTNNDTLNSIAWLDLRAEPMVISVPEMPDRYYTFQLVDMYTFNFAYIGTRATGTGAGNYMVASPTWKGDKPAGINGVFQSEGNFVYSLTRTEVDGAEDLENAQAIQQQYKVQPLSAFLGQPAPPAAPGLRFPPFDQAEAQSAGFIEYFNFLLGQVTIDPSEKDMIDSFGRLGIGPNRPFDADALDPATRAAIDAGVAAALKKIKLEGARLGERQNGWVLPGQIFGTREEMDGRYLTRAAAAYWGLYGNSLEEAYYPTTKIDPAENPLDASKNRYVLKFTKEQIPQVNAFWSLTMYDADQMMVDNPIDRYSIGDRTEGLQYGADGSLEIYLQSDSPGKDKESNWLPAPDGLFSLTLRMYLPQDSALNPLYAPPGIQKLDSSSTKLTARMLTQPNSLAGPSPSSFNWSPIGATLVYVEPQDGQDWEPSRRDMLWLYDAASSETRLLLDPAGSAGNIDVTSAQWSPDGNRLLLTGDEAFWLLDAATGELTSLDAGGGDSTSVVFTPDGTRVSYVQDNDLCVLDIDSGDVQRLTSDGGETVFNGALDWVYTEELATRAAQPAYAWSPDGVWLIYLRLDESAVNQDPVTDYQPAPATVSYTRYPTVGTPNPTATLHALAQGATAPPLELPLPAGAEYVLPFFTWTPDSNHALYITVNRDHTELTLNRWTPQSGELRALIQETASDWINEDRYAAPIFIGDGSQFLWISERDGFMHLYLYTAEGELVRQVTQGSWMIDSSAYNLLTPGRPVHVDPEGSWAYFTTTRTSPLERQVDRVNIASGQIEQVSQQPGFHHAALSADGKYLVDQHSDVATPPITAIVKTDGSGAEVLAQAAGPALDLPQMAREFVTVKAPDGVDLYAQLVKPEAFDPSQQYPVVVHWYGGPGLQMVSNRYGSTNIFNIIERDVLYTQEGFLVWRLDNRGSFGRGHAFEAPIFGELGKAALEDQLAGIEYLQTLPYVDAARIGTDGKSFGGYMTLYALLHAPDVFRCGVAGAAPTDWSYYDTIYTERYMRTPEANPEGYAATNLLAMAGQIQARPLLIHGLADTNVHLQNTVNFIQALQENDKLFSFVPLPNLSHSFRGNGLVAALSASADYLSACLTGGSHD